MNLVFREVFMKSEERNAEDWSLRQTAEGNGRSATL
ncbi:hypothetical protein BDP_1702 [Bifidobacterium dentium Bd1]|uniref:Uncharacterized protein n=1 Tax=Bifidobacterium dentium (strain ATCC 27534 / DSM 20436 / JCM 1195 / Bd1) TaxID=401473 RepID=D2Q5S9_BIFDB|nr:hypothetical protein BDP_1702 [Bifidobacterium dentium Bd1]